MTDKPKLPEGGRMAMSHCPNCGDEFPREKGQSYCQKCRIKLRHIIGPTFRPDALARDEGAK